MPDQWAGVANTSNDSLSAAPATPAELERWWQNFHDAELNSLIARALAANLDVKTAEAALRQARASRGIVAGALWPTLNASGGYTRSGGGTAAGNTFQTGLDSVWALDIFGGTRRNVESANASIEAASDSLAAARVLLVAEVALDYIQLRGDQEQIAIAQENLKAEQHTAQLTRQLLTAGFASALDTANAEAQVATTASTIPVLDTALRQDIFALSLLLGSAPADLLAELSTPAPVPLTPPRIPAGIPSDLLRRRPDIRAAEAQLHSATAQIGVAVAAFFPQFSMTASGGYQSNLLSTFFSTGARTWASGPQVNWPILQGGALAANVSLQKALRDQAYLNYQKTVLVALQEVENALVAYANEWDHQNALAEAYAQNRKALDLSMQLYSRGNVDFLTVLVAERSLYSSQSALALSKQAISTDLVSLYQALGGGWDGSP
jgi:NodT family efflux transporter outer membrane factor (OMF) lipoprotein